MKCAVVKGSRQEGNVRIRYKGSYDACIEFMRINRNWDDLIYLNEDGSL